MIFDFMKLSKLYGRMGSVYEKLNDYENAIEFYNKSLLENRDSNIAEGLRRVQRLKTKRDEEAYQNPELADEANAKANELFKAGKFPDAKKEYDEAVKRNPKMAKYYCNRGVCL